jgi:hypothetical protein
VLATLGAIVAALLVVTSGELALVLAPILAIIVAVVLLLEGESRPIILGVVLALGAIVGFLSITPVNTERLDLTGLNESLGASFVAGLGLWIVAAALVLLWDGIQPNWLRIGGAVLLAITYVAFFAIDDADFGNLTNIPVAVTLVILALLCAAPMVRLAWALSPGPAPPTGPPSE